MKDGRRRRDEHDEQTPRLPAVGEYVRMVGRLVAVVDSEPQPPPPKNWVFEGVDARVELRRRGRVLETCCTFNDFYFGEFGAVRSALEDVRGICTREGIDEHSEVEVVVVKVTTQENKRFVEHDALPWSYDRQFRRFESANDWRGLSEPVEVDVWNSRGGILVVAFEDDDRPCCPVCGEAMVESSVSPTGWSWVCHQRKCFGEGARAEWRKETT